MANEFLWKKWKKIFNIKLDNKIFKYIYKVIFFEAIKKKDQKMLIPFKHNSKILKINFISEWQQHDTKNILSTHESVIKLSDSEIDYGMDLLQKYNVNKNDKIILLCVRDPFYTYAKKHNIKNNLYLANDKLNLEYSNRDCRIDNFKDLVNFLCKKNYKVFRMGNIMHERLEFSHQNFIDYAFEDAKSSFLDLFLFYLSEFTISSGYGLDSMSSLFRKKRIYLNFGEFSSFNLRLNKNISFIYPKQVFDNELNKTLNLINIFEKGLHKLKNYNDLKYKNLELKSLNSQQMIEAVKDMENYIKSGYSSELIHKNNQVNKYLYDVFKVRTDIFWYKKFLNEAYNEIKNNN